MGSGILLIGHGYTLNLLTWRHMAVKVLQKIMDLIAVGQMVVHFPPMLPEGAHENFTVLGSMRVWSSSYRLVAFLLQQ
jgi:hypothetical protein